MRDGKPNKLRSQQAGSEMLPNGNNSALREATMLAALQIHHEAFAPTIATEHGARILPNQCTHNRNQRSNQTMEVREKANSV